MLIYARSCWKHLIGLASVYGESSHVVIIIIVFTDETVDPCHHNKDT